MELSRLDWVWPSGRNFKNLPKTDQTLIIWQFFAARRSIPFSNIWFWNIINCIWWPVLASFFNLEIIFWNWFLNRTLSSILWLAFSKFIFIPFSFINSFLAHFTWYQVRMKSKIEYMTEKIQIGWLLTREWHLNLSQWYKEYNFSIYFGKVSNRAWLR